MTLLYQQGSQCLGKQEAPATSKVSTMQTREEPLYMTLPQAWDNPETQRSCWALRTCFALWFLQAWQIHLSSQIHLQFNDRRWMCMDSSSKRGQISSIHLAKPLDHHQVFIYDHCLYDLDSNHIYSCPLDPACPPFSLAHFSPHFSPYSVLWLK